MSQPVITVTVRFIDPLMNPEVYRVTGFHFDPSDGSVTAQAAEGSVVPLWFNKHIIHSITYRQ